MAKGYLEYKGYTIKTKHSIARGQWMAYFWRDDPQYIRVYQTVWMDTPEEARRLAKLSIASLIAFPVSSRARFAEGEA